MEIIFAGIIIFFFFIAAPDIWIFDLIVAMNLAAAPPEVFPQCLLYLMVSSYLLQTRSNVQTHSK